MTRTAGVDDAPRFTNMYRDGHAGAEARRNELAEERRVQLALLPLGIAQVFAHRIGRAAAGAMAVVCAAAMVLLISDPLVLHMVKWLVPGVALSIGMCALIASTAILVSYVVATWIAEAWFTRRMRAAIETHADVYSDLDNLARGPIDVAQRLVRRIDGWSVGLMLAGVTTLGSVFAYLVVVTLTVSPLAFVMSTTRAFTATIAASNVGIAMFALVMASGFAVVVARAVNREHRVAEQPRTTRWLSHWSALAGAAVLGLCTMLSTAAMLTSAGLADFMYASPEMLPSIEKRLGLAIVGEAALCGATAWGLLWWRRRERARLAD